ncbi:uncharacterized protein LOC124885858 [Capsicum annuum]|uniref:uncharacterized protein LOC124885858 n=1 Tax=Capsicum annuum TaxID=4072 RepID=UPI001FB0C43F|nr:uncharacterized protein LOC124885858 [Capsicum annuum]
MQLLKESLPEDNIVLDNYYQTKKLVSSLCLPVEKIDCCESGCMLYWGDDDGHLTSCKDIRCISVVLALVRGNWSLTRECPSNPKHKIDVYLQPLIKELTLLWETGVEAFDISKRQNFQLRAALIWTISDFPAYSMLSGWSTVGKLACPYCIEETQSFRLQHGRKQSWFDCHRMFLDQHHPFRRDQKNFLKGQTVRRPPPTNRTGEEILDQICNLGIINVTELDAEQVSKIICKICGWKMRSIFWDLPYWSSNMIRHNLDVMHIKKNFFNNILNNVLNFDDKTKDNPQSRLDTAKYYDRPQSGKDSNGQYPKVVYTLDKEAKAILFNWVKCLKFPDGYVSNLGRLPDTNAKSETSSCALPYEARVAGPVQYRWMYPFERYLGTLRKMIMNKASAEGSICEAYLMMESTQLFSHYFEPHVMSRNHNVDRNDDGGVVEDLKGNLSIFSRPGRLWGEAKKRDLILDEIKAAQTYILLNCEEVEPFVSMYLQYLEEEFSNLSQSEIDESHEENFTIWFKGYARCNPIENEYLRSLAREPLIGATSHSVYFVNRYKFHTECHGSMRSTMNSGVCISDPNFGDYYGRIKEIIQVEYHEAPLKQIVLFKCE